MSVTLLFVLLIQFFNNMIDYNHGTKNNTSSVLTIIINNFRKFFAINILSNQEITTLNRIAHRKNIFFF